METGIKVGDCMKTTLVTIDENASIFDAAALMKKKKVSGLFVTNARNEIYALVTDADIVRRAVAAKKMSVKVKDIATKPLIGIEASRDISDAAKLMGQRDVKRLVVFKQHKVAGIISVKDIIRISPSLYDLVAETAAVQARI
ncbi:MAG: CBS domain-containing protein [Candidatus Norongarragalinales archaeon]